MTSRWRLLDSGPSAGDWNMALDRALLDCAAGGNVAPVLRFYSWQAPTLSLGRMQRPSDDLLGRCAELGVTAVRRPTGGKAILHHDEVTFSIIAPTAGMGPVIESYRTFARAIAAGLRDLGVKAQLYEAGCSQRAAGVLCFAAPARCDLEVAGKKLLGSAQRRRRAALLQQNSLPLRLPHELKRELFGVRAVEEELRVATDISSALGREPSFAQARHAIIAGFRSELSIEFEPSSLTADESAAAEKLRSVVAL